MKGFCKYFLPTFFFLFVLYINHSLAQQYRVTQLSVDNNLSHSDVTSIVEDSYGYIWLATNNGLNRYNGYDVVKFQHKLNDEFSLPHNRIKTLNISQSGNNNLFLGAEKGIATYITDKERFERKISFDKYDNIFSHLKEDKNNVLWYVDRKWVLHGVDKSNNEQLYKLPFEGEVIGLELFNDKVWIGVNGRNGQNKGVLIFDPKTKTFDSIDVLKTFRLYSMKAKKDAIYIASYLGVYEFKNVADYKRLFRFKGNHIPFNINGIDVDHKKDIWLSYYHKQYFGPKENGLLRLSVVEGEYQIYEKYNLEKFFKSSSINSIMIDSHDILWVSTWGEGAFYMDLREKSFRLLNKQNGYDIINDYISAIYETESTLWLGTRGGLSMIEKSGNTFSRDVKHFLKGEYITEITSSKEGTLLVNTQRSGLFEYKEDGFESALHLPKVYFRSMDVDDDGLLWIVEDGKGILLYDLENRKEVFLLNKDNFLPSNLITFTYKDPIKSDIIWVGTMDAGLLRIKRNEGLKFDVQSFTSDENDTSTIGSNFIWPIIRENDSTLWVGTIGGGLNKLMESAKGISFERVTDEEGLICNDIESLEIDIDGNIWFGGSGLGRLNPKTLAVKHFDVNDGLQSNSFKVDASYSNQKGGLYFGGTNGLNYFVPSDFHDNPFPPKVVIENISIDGKRIKVGEKINGRVLLTSPLNNKSEITLLANENNFSIDLVGIHLSNTRKNKYKYQLVGGNEKWIPLKGNQRSLLYNNLEAGEYILNIKAGSNDGKWSRVKTLKINILPPWWATLWFKGIVVLLILAMAISYYKYRTYLLKKRQVELEKQVSIRTLELSNANEEIKQQATSLEQKAVMLSQQAEELEAQRDNLDSKNKIISEKNEHITASISYAQTIQKATLPFTEMFEKNFSEHFVLYRPKDIVSGDFYWMAEHNNITYLAAVDCTGHGVPGAFMSMIGHSLLNKIVHEQGITEVHEIIESLDKEVQKALKQEKSRNDDGMDLIICAFEKNESGQNKRTVTFCGAKNGIYHYNKTEHELIEIKGNRRSVGGRQSREPKPFTAQTIEVMEGDSLYLITDGILDQNQADRRRIGKRGFAEILNKAISASSLLIDQHEIITSSLDAFQGDEKQRDDITVIGVRL